MKKILLCCLMVLTMLSVTSAQAVELDLSGADAMVTGTDSIRLENVKAIGKTLWIDMVWDARSNNFVVADYGVESAHGNVFGEWIRIDDWNCSHSGLLETYMTLNDDGTFDDSHYLDGDWIQDGNSVTMRYETGTVYVGTINADGTMNGTMTSYTGVTGCWSAERER